MDRKWLMGLTVPLCLLTLGPGGLSAEEVLRDCGDCPEMVVVPAGSFMMGTTEAAGQLVTTSAAEVVLVLPERDRHPILERMARWLAAPASVVALRPPWVSG